MSTSASQDRNFIDSIIGSDLLENAIDWIGKNMEPADVFSESELQSWAENNGYELPKD